MPMQFEELRTQMLDGMNDNRSNMLLMDSLNFCDGVKQLLDNMNKSSQRYLNIRNGTGIQKIQKNYDNVLNDLNMNRERLQKYYDNYCTGSDPTGGPLG